MARILAISSQVVRGAVGLGLTVPALRRFGHEVLALPTILLSNHPGYPLSARFSVSPEDLSRILDALDGNAWLAGLDAVLTGYLPTPGHVHFARDAVQRVRTLSPGALVVADPIVGDDPRGPYIDIATAYAIRDELLPEVDFATPNRFELSFLSRRPVGNLDQAARALDCIGCGGGLATSIPCPGKTEMVNLLSAGSVFAATTVPSQATAPNGTGDLMCAMFLGALLAAHPPASALGLATAAVADALEQAGASDTIDPAYVSAIPLGGGWPVETFAGRS